MKAKSKTSTDNVAVKVASSTNGCLQNDTPRHGCRDLAEDSVTRAVPRPVNGNKSPEPSTKTLPEVPLSYAERRKMMVEFSKEMIKVPGVRVQTDEELREENRYYRFYGDPDSEFGKE
jgi:hypothetical protein